MVTAMTACPKCAFEQPGEFPECGRCGVVFARYICPKAAAGEPAPSPERHQGIEIGREAAAGSNSASGQGPAIPVRGAGDGGTTGLEIAPGAEWALEAVGSIEAAASVDRVNPAEGLKPKDAASAVNASSYPRAANFGREPGEYTEASATAVNAPIPGLDPSARRSLALGGVMALVFSFVPFLSFIFHYLVTLVHEFGHFATNWIFGYPSVPAFDFRHGGGVTMHHDRNAFVLFGIYLLMAVIIYQCRERKPLLIALCGLAGAHLLASLTPLHELLQVFMGHGAELIFAGFFLYRALSGEKLKVAAERPLYAFCGFFIILSDIQFAYGLVSSHEKRVEYELAKGGGAWMDFSRIAENYLGVALTQVAGFFLMLTLAVPVLTWVAFRQRDRIREAMARLISA
jgi:hypothetical protein